MPKHYVASAYFARCPVMSAIAITSVRMLRMFFVVAEVIALVEWLAAGERVTDRVPPIFDAVTIGTVDKRFEVLARSCAPRLPFAS